MRSGRLNEGSPIQLGGDIPSMLKKVKKELSHRKYRELCAAVNNAEDYTTKKGLITACLKAKKNNL